MNYFLCKGSGFFAGDDAGKRDGQELFHSFYQSRGDEQMNMQIFNEILIKSVGVHHRDHESS